VKTSGVLEVQVRPDELYLALVEVTAAWRGKGLGADIVRWLLERAGKLHRPLRLHVLKANPRAVGFYERHGLRVIDSEPLKLLMSSDPYLT
jgi:GNAT superfamily N-acetyltransferase